MSTSGNSSFSSAMSRRKEAHTGSASFRDKLDRFEEYPDVRHRTLIREENRNSHIGPGTYDVNDRAGSRMHRVRSPVMYRQTDSQYTDKTFISAAPPVGTYDIPRIMSPPTVPSKRVQHTSSFKTSGRERGLLSNAVLYQTLNEDKTMSNIGPGMYDLSQCPSYMGQQLISPTKSDRRYRAHRARDAQERDSRPSTGESSPHNDKPRISDIFLESRNSRPSSPSPVSALFTQISFSPAERMMEIQSVRDLPDYK
mmetsp:Transcript_9400/g.14162  ORF Transcript_9400/g.14162 Transcript_9400/m.14162 type:complete len:254 (-) Transcript_9400:298-1059(-)|eukprot:CAMPEP_0185018500 /NCGR_PEP_ID=MMETSP1103-20130426/1205_1 /TAXON_ID=36769 /ORGANISM="Paraphysomonas bandaiensis, Strain Caron Lab Isolate" /LENGTH=253 /DNA_ID=CAMNT_0027548337 /DNA_START=166 /DNA_END=927 /DNA_ORIENTATION=-